jgi:hypothetical protein
MGKYLFIFSHLGFECSCLPRLYWHRGNAHLSLVNAPRCIDDAQVCCACNVVLCGKSLRDQPVVGPQGCMSMACGHDRVDEKKHGQQLSTFNLEYFFLDRRLDTPIMCARACFRMRTRVCMCACVINVSIRKLQPPLAARQHALQR